MSMLREILEKETSNKVIWTDDSLAKGIYNGVEFRLLISGRNYLPDIGLGACPFDGIVMNKGKNKIYKEYNDDIKVLINSVDVCALNFRQDRNVGIGFPVLYHKASDYFNGGYDNVKEDSELLKISNKIGHKQAYKKLEKVVPEIIEMFSKNVEGAFFFDKDLQKSYKKK